MQAGCSSCCSCFEPTQLQLEIVLPPLSSEVVRHRHGYEEPTQQRASRRAGQVISSAEAAVSFGSSAACESTVSSCAGIGSCRRHVRRRRRGARNEAVCAVALHPCLYVGRRDRKEKAKSYVSPDSRWHAWIDAAGGDSDGTIELRAAARGWETAADAGGRINRRPAWPDYFLYR